MSLQWTLSLGEQAIALMASIEEWEQIAPTLPDEFDGERSLNPLLRFSHFVTQMRVLDREGLAEKIPDTRPANEKKKHPVPKVSFRLTHKGRLILEAIRIEIGASRLIYQQRLPKKSAAALSAGEVAR